MTNAFIRSPLDRRQVLGRLGALLGAGLPAGMALAADNDDATYDQDSVLKAATDFFGSTTEGLAKVIEKAFKEQGRPNAYIKGQEASGALTLGLRYGEGQLMMKNGGASPVFWAGPSIGFDAGANASKVFTLVYKLPRASAIYQRFPGVDGSFYYVGGAGINYQRLNGITLAPIRLGVGLRAGASIGYLHYRPEKSYNPF
ncbi:DUF1134 domain-containing protein [Roseateles violae]|uniref:DUF1134 domain-containing protein n=1 Tax=Roseateles violae TaxID=3058042 RepID=A0ABT8DW91_9BURK|nr:DUF1134 domain-containing protein [Pelomonas sp. PFR6]MDN3922565.1 DUF1134 domain-containing protein [Pelomonas sp. PFR6]